MVISLESALQAGKHGLGLGEGLQNKNHELKAKLEEFSAKNSEMTSKNEKLASRVSAEAPTPSRVAADAHGLES